MSKAQGSPRALGRLLRHVQFDVFEIARLVVDANLGRRNPRCILAGFIAGLHQRLDIIAIGLGWQPFVLALGPFVGRDDVAIGVDSDSREHTDLTVEPFVGQLQFEIDARLGNLLVPAAHATGRICQFAEASA